MTVVPKQFITQSQKQIVRNFAKILRDGEVTGEGFLQAGRIKTEHILIRDIGRVGGDLVKRYDAGSGWMSNDKVYRYRLDDPACKILIGGDAYFYLVGVMREDTGCGNTLDIKEDAASYFKSILDLILAVAGGGGKNQLTF